MISHSGLTVRVKIRYHHVFISKTDILQPYQQLCELQCLWGAVNRGWFHLAFLTLSYQSKTDKCQCHSGAWGKATGVLKVRIHPLGTTNVLTKFHGNPSHSCAFSVKCHISGGSTKHIWNPQCHKKQIKTVNHFVSTYRAAAAQVEPRLCDRIICCPNFCIKAPEKQHSAPIQPTSPWYLLSRLSLYHISWGAVAGIMHREQWGSRSLSFMKIRFKKMCPEEPQLDRF